MIVEREPKSIAAESYRTLRTNIQYSSFDEDYKVIVITSSEPGEGKSITAGNLALSLAQGDKKVILIDCDLRKPSIHKKFKLSNTLGLSDVIVEKESVTNVGYKYNKNLTVLTSGKIPPNPAEMLGSKAMTALLDALKKVFDYVIIDTPPVQAVTDAQILSAKADGTILVVRAEKTKKDSVHNSVGLLKKVNANIIGTVLNGLEASNNNYYYYYGAQ
ncbi:CpsD/CapB family tyrosine-protein kinase [Clostridium culturomicium]|uniref:CpsD/CapB family tyrosine-protein kinase n=1 Tax=Clostridium culturomicium TaxID=1499683 RepID=UPI00058CF4E2|nr:CpsD/CapB family tyrosine-protein kinase [Clostridium culturomicium]